MPTLPRTFPDAIPLHSTVDTARRPDARERGPVPESALLSTLLAGPRQRRVAAAAVLLSILVFAALVPFARVPLVPVPAFIPAYETALVIIDLITAVLLLQQFGPSRSAALFALAAGYLFDALLTIAHALSFPGLITAAGWLGGGNQTTAWIYMFWHAGFPIFVIAYAGLSRRAAAGEPATVDPWSAALSGAAIFGAALLLILIEIEADNMLPPIMSGHSYTTAMVFVVGS